MAGVEGSDEWRWAGGTFLGPQQTAVGTPPLPEVRGVQELLLENLPSHTGHQVYKEEVTLTSYPPGGDKVFPREEVLTDIQVTIQGPEENPCA